MRRGLILAALAALVGACGGGSDPAGGGGDAGADAYVGPSTALFELPRGGPTSEFYALPFPNDLRRRADGSLDLTGHERPGILETYLPIFETKVAGFGTNAAIFFRFSDPIDAATLPADPAASLFEGAAVYLVDVDPASPARGTRWPLRYRFEPRHGQTIGDNWLSCLPYPGFPLQSTTTYAAVVTNRLHAPDGTAVARAADFEAVAAGGGGDAVAAAAALTYAPLLDWLDEPGGDERADVISAAVFTTQDTTSLMGRLREVVLGTPAPAPVGLSFVRFDANFVLYEGTYQAPNFQSGDPPYNTMGGEIVLDGDTPIVQRTESIRFAVSFPTETAVPAQGWPIVLYEHGTGGDYLTFVDGGEAGRFAAAGLAVISIDAVLHGPRDPTHSDPDLAFFNYQNPVAARDNVRQGAADNYQLLRLARGLDFTLSHANAQHQHVDPDRIYFMGHSQGGITGPLFLAHEPLVKGAILSGAGGLLYLSLLYKTEPVNIQALVTTLLNEASLDEFNNALALVQMFIEPGDAANYGPLLARVPLAGVGPKDVFQSEGFVDHYTPPPCIEALGVAIGSSPVAPVLQPVEGFGLRGVEVLQPPVSANLNGRTSVFVQYNAAFGADGHFVLTTVPDGQRQHVEFLRTLAASGIATLVP